MKDVMLEFSLMLQNNLKYSINGFSDHSDKVYENAGNVSGHKNRDIQSKKNYIMTNYMYFKMMLNACCLVGKGSDNAR